MVLAEVLPIFFVDYTTDTNDSYTQPVIIFFPSTHQLKAADAESHPTVPHLLGIPLIQGQANQESEVLLTSLHIPLYGNYVQIKLGNPINN